MKFLTITCAVFAALIAAGPLSGAGSQAGSVTASVAYLDQALAAARPGQKTARLGDMEILVSNLKTWRAELTGEPTPQLAFDGAAPTWPGGNVYYTFDTNAATAVPPSEQRVFLSCANEWATFANLHFIPWTTQANYVLVTQQGGLEGGFSTVGMIGGEQTLAVGPTSWNHATVCHEIGHTLGLVHEHQRSDRDNYVTIFSNNIAAGDYGNYVLLPNSRNQTPYDFLSIMHYSRNAFAINPAMDTMEPLPPYSQYLNIMGAQFDPTLSADDRAGMALVYGPGPVINNIVTNTQDSGPGSLRTALYYAFDHPGTTITFNIATNDSGFSNNVFNIQPTDRLPSLVNATTLDGSTEPTQANGQGPAVMLNGALAPPPDLYINGIRLGGTNCVVKSLAVNGFSYNGIMIDGSNAVGNVVAGCYIGLDLTGSSAVTNLIYPLEIDGGAISNVVGGTTPAARNVIGGSAYQGVAITDPGTAYNQVMGNYIGLNAAGTASVSNTWSGVAVFNGAQSNIIGGASPTMRNIISGNGEQGVTISTGATANIIEGNYIGLDPTGTFAISNTWSGIDLFQGAFGNYIGRPGAPNVVSGNGNQGILIQDTGSDSNIVRGNLAGLNPAGNASAPNGYSGLEIYNGPTANLIGGVSAGARNVFSGNVYQGVVIDSGSYGNFVEGNYMGLDVSGLVSIPNGASGVEIFTANGNTIGGLIGARNFISGNSNAGINIDSGAGGNFVFGNSIGVNVTNGPAPNAYQGVSIFNSAESNQIGGAGLGEANLIADNVYDAVDVFDTNTAANTIRGNSMVGNGGGINLYYGGNNSAPSPTLSSAEVGTNLVVSGSLSSTPSMTFHLDFYASPNSSPEGAVYLGARDVLTSAGGTANFTLSFGAVAPEPQVITATATDPNGNTSGLSYPISVRLTDSVGDGIPDAWRAAHFGGSGTTTNSTSCATCDPDHDGMDNYQEFLAGTDPNNSASALRTGPLTVAAGTPTVSFDSEPGIVYRLDYRNALDSGDWEILVDQIIGSGALMQIMDTSALGVTNRFYRINALP